MSATRYRAPPAAGLTIVPLDELVAVFHRASGITHLITLPVADLLEAIGGRWMTIDAIESEFEVADGDSASLSAALDELVTAGLVERA